MRHGVRKKKVLKTNQRGLSEGVGSREATPGCKWWHSDRRRRQDGKYAVRVAYEVVANLGKHC
jgi:hypothetical protein